MNKLLYRAAIYLLTIACFLAMIDCSKALAKHPVKDQPFAKLKASQWRSLGPGLKGDSQENFPAEAWWEAFNDPNLNTLMDQALSGNLTIKQALENIYTAQQIAKTYRAPLLPTVSTAPQYTWQQYGQHQFVFPLHGRTYQTFITPLTTTYEVDFLGKNRATYQSALKGVDVARYQYEATKILLASNVVTTYVNVSKFRHMEKLAQAQVETSQKLLKHSQKLLELGQATIFDIQNSQLVLDQANVDLSLLSGNRQVAENQLEALLGKEPTSNTLPPITHWDAFQLKSRFLTGIPSELVTRRPDVAIAEAQLEAARLNVEAARRALLPSINLLGTTGLNAIGIQHLLRATSLSNLLISSISQPIFTGGRLRAEVNLRKSKYRLLLSEYQNTLVNAFTDVENNLAQLQANNEAYQEIQNQTASITDIAAKEKAKMEAGISSAPLWLVRESQRITYEKALAQQKAQLMIDYVGLSKALGGGFNLNPKTSSVLREESKQP